ncbi:MAG: molybdopterin-synthase adenylyltransferase MoeB [Flavobacteriia bacterium]|jgi:molybdopterin/thiamine biosynthesis adenylyltransferase
MLSQQEILFYKRQLSLDKFHLENQMKLKNAKVLVVGAGGLACPALQYLCGVGVGHIGIMDGDEISVHNLHRQILYDYDSVGQKKTEIARKKLLAINPFIGVEIYSFFLDENNALTIIEKYDIVVDCTDNFEARYLINDCCVLLDKPFVYGAIYRFEGHVSVFNYQNGPTYRCLFPFSENNNSILNCNEDGVLGVLPGLIGIHQAIETVKLITGLGELLSGKLMMINLLTSQSRIITVEKKNIDYLKELIKTGIKVQNYKCDSNLINQIEVIDLKNMKNFIYLDVRNLDEKPRILTSDKIEIPLIDLRDKLHELPTDKNIVCVCQSGKRSKEAQNILSELLDPSLIYNLKSGFTNEFTELWKEQ